MTETKLMKLSNVAAINRELKKGWCLDYTVGLGKEQVAVLRKYPQQNTLGHVRATREYGEAELPTFIAPALAVRALPE